MNFFVGLFILFLVVLPAAPRVIDISPVWSGHPAGFDLLTQGDRQFVAFYDDQRRMTIGSRALNSTQWKLVRLPSQIGWDSHNYVTMAIDNAGYIHVSGNMHVHSLIYFRSSKPLDIDSFEELNRMTGKEEARCTYPVFFRGPANELIFRYRDGRSGSGNEMYNVYDEKTRQWRRLLDQPLTDGQGRMNAYPSGPVRGPDGYFHLVWVWRNTPDCSTNHDLSYARSKDMVHWETSAGKPLSLPMRVDTAEIVDPVPVKGGIINGCARVSWDSKKRPLITYHKFDENGKTQAYCARIENGKWKSYVLSDWDYRWYFEGGGSIPFEIHLGGVSVVGGGKLALDYTHPKSGSGRIIFDESTMKPIAKEPSQPRPWPAALDKPESEFPGMSPKFLQHGKYLLRWETLGPNRDRPREGPLPGPSMLRLYELESVHAN
jgi:hypothetical protein